MDLARPILLSFFTVTIELEKIKVGLFDLIQPGLLSFYSSTKFKSLLNVSFESIAAVIVIAIIMIAVIQPPV